ncbi:unnamed protein product [Vicia faba]|uniref:USP domain-containing protein n=1 Tax=Vicia faba TaxID=3906 RepID=A0AAV0Z3K9_VICFA|nr:unnamed protein product [Vicia faba]CAI8591583.1 unnamed protein product [Vicia faba]
MNKYLEVKLLANCGFSFDIVDPIFDLGLTVEDVNTVQRTLDAYIMVEKIPVLHLRKFKMDIAYYGKIENHVYFTIVGFGALYLCRKNPNLMYDLYAVVVHSEYTTNSRHYFDYVRSDEKA